MPKRVILCLLALCMVLMLSCCGQTNTLGTLYSISKAFLNAHYSATVSQAEEYKQLQAEIETRIESLKPPQSPGLNSLENLAPDLAKRLEDLIKQKYESQPLTDKCFDRIVNNGMPRTLWDIVLKEGSDIKVTSVKTSLRSNDIDDKENDIDYTADLLINNTSYEVNGVLVLILADNKWMIDNVSEFGWTPSFPD